MMKRRMMNSVPGRSVDDEAGRVSKAEAGHVCTGVNPAGASHLPDDLPVARRACLGVFDEFAEEGEGRLEERQRGSTRGNN